MPKESVNCAVCGAPDNGFVTLNRETAGYSGIEIAVARGGMLRARSLNEDGSMLSQDILNVPFCPLCGRRFDKK